MWASFGSRIAGTKIKKVLTNTKSSHKTTHANNLLLQSLIVGYIDDRHALNAGPVGRQFRPGDGETGCKD